MPALLLVLCSLAPTTLAGCGASEARSVPATTTSRPSAEAGGLWIDPATIARLPTTGAAWSNLEEAARADWGRPDLSDLTSLHDTSTLAGALVAVRTGDQALMAKTREAIMDVVHSDRFDRVLELARNITSYVIAADLIHLPSQDDRQFRAFIDGLRTKELKGHSGAEDLVATAERSPTNWGTMARAAAVAIDLYLGDLDGAREMAETHRAWLGERAPNDFVYTDTAWHAADPPVGINPPGARIDGHDADGILPEDQRRTGEPDGAAPRGSYPWEALQGAVVTSVLLDRADLLDFDAGDDALVRAMGWLYDTNDNPPEGDDVWLPWIVNAEAGTSFDTITPTRPGKNMGWSDWTHGPTR